MSDIRELLREAVATPPHELDVVALSGAARRRRRRRVILGGASVLSVAAVAAGFVLADTAGGPRIEVATASRAANESAGVSVELPAGWRDLPRTDRTAPEEVLVVGTASRPEGDPIQACVVGTGLPSSQSAFVTLYEYQSGDDLIGPGGSSQYSMAAFQERPARFATSERVLSGDCESPRSGPSSSLPVTGSFAQTDPTTTAPPATTVTSEASAPTTLAGPVTNNHFREIAFSESGRLFLARIVSVSDPTEELLDEGLAVLDSLVVEAVDKPPEQAAPDEAAAEQAIVDAINAANGTPSPVPLAISVEGGHPFANPEDASAAAEHAANADDTTRSAYEASKDGKIVARINWIEFDSETRARLNFDLLVDGQQITVTTTGYAVLEDGNWRLGRETFCEIFSRGGVQCPA